MKAIGSHAIGGLLAPVGRALGPVFIFNVALQSTGGKRELAGAALRVAGVGWLTLSMALAWAKRLPQ